MPVKQVDARQQRIPLLIRNDVRQVAEVAASPRFPAGHERESPVRTALAELIPPQAMNSRIEMVVWNTKMTFARAPLRRPNSSRKASTMAGACATASRSISASNPLK